jgi:pimeloyl-ACP methyl ester carboxylesterase
MTRHSSVSLLVVLTTLLVMLLIQPLPAPSVAAVRVPGEDAAGMVSLQGATPGEGPIGQEEFAGLVEIDGGRRMYLECRGWGSPTVVLEAGYGNRADIWSVDLFEPEGSRPMVFPAVASFARVCAYDRPGTIGNINPVYSPLAEGDPSLRSRSDPVPMPRTAQDIVADLHALLHAAGVPGPYVLVGHSLGGPIVRLYASAYPDEVAGLVFVDSAHEEQNAQLAALLSPAQWVNFHQLQQSTPPEWAWYPDFERVDFDASFVQLGQARTKWPLRSMPLAVLTAGRSDDVPIPDWPADAFVRMWRAMQDDLASLVPNARHSIASRSGHYIHQEQPALVIEAIRQVVTGVRDRDTWFDLASCCAS